MTNFSSNEAWNVETDLLALEITNSSISPALLLDLNPDEILPKSSPRPRSCVFRSLSQLPPTLYVRLRSIID